MGETNYLLNIDVLGFGDFVNKNSLDTVFNYYSKIITGSAFSGELMDKDNIEIMIYSDTIAIKSNNSNKDQCLFDLVRIANQIQHGQYYSAICLESVFLPVRGVITYGEFVFHKGGIWTQAAGRPKIEAKNINLIFGKSIIEFYNFEKDLQIINIALGTSAIEHKPALIDLLAKKNMIIKYNIPLKKDKEKNLERSINGYLTNPVASYHFKENMKRLEQEEKKFSENKNICDKYINTIKFFNYVNTNKLFY